jgi:hypothetical protein
VRSIGFDRTQSLAAQSRGFKEPAQARKWMLDDAVTRYVQRVIGFEEP